MSLLKVVEWPHLPSIGAGVVPERGHGPVLIEQVFIGMGERDGTVKLQPHRMVDTVEFHELIAILREDGWY